jgi:excisionase family DNA binding protein
VHSKPDLLHSRTLPRDQGNRKQPGQSGKPRYEVAPNALSFSIKDACRLTGIARTRLFSLLADGHLRKVKVGGRTLVEGDSLRALVQGMRIKS